MKGLATLILLYFFLREWGFVIKAHRDGHSGFWTVVGSAIALSLMVPFWLVWS